MLINTCKPLLNVLFNYIIYKFKCSRYLITIESNKYPNLKYFTYITKYF